MASSRALALLLTCALLATVHGPASAQEDHIEVPTANQIPLFLKVLSFDRRLHERAASEVVVAIVHQSRHRASVNARDEALLAIAQAPAQLSGKSIRVVIIDLDRETLAAAMERLQPLALYITPLRGADIAVIAKAARTAQVTTMAGMVRYMSQGLAVGVRLQGDRPRLLINVEAARLEGASFQSDLLRLAQVM